MVLAAAGSTSAQTARDYFNELKAANTFNHYKDEYVCFHDDDAPSFAIVAKASDVMEDMKKAGDAAGVKLMALAKDSLLVQTYYKGVGSEEYIYDPIKRLLTDDSKEYFIEFNAPSPGKMTYSINWVTGRYLLRVFIFQKSRSIPSGQSSGKCERIHPTQ